MGVEQPQLLAAMDRVERVVDVERDDGDSAAKTERMIPMSSPAKLTDTQRAILFEASKRKDRCLIAPKTLKAAATQKVAAKLLKAGLVSEIKARSGMEIWRRDEETGQAYAPSSVPIAL